MWVWLVFCVGQQAESIERQRAAIEKQLASIRKQKDAVRQQIKLAPTVQDSFFVTMDSGTEPGCLPLPVVRQQALVDSVAKRSGLSPSLLDAVIRQESAFKPCSVSEKGAMGLMQLMPSTAQELGVEDAFDPEQNVEAGATLLKRLMVRYGGDLIRVLGAYNAGPARVDEAGGLPAIPETMNYVEGILGRLQKQD